MTRVSSPSDAPSGAGIAGRHALVTGAGRGIGAAIAAGLAAEGARVTLLGRDAGRLAEAAERIGGPATSNSIATVVADVTDEDAVGRALAEAGEANGPLDILVNNAGAAASAPLARTGLELWRRMIDINLTGTFLCARAALPGMVGRGRGRIVNIASTAGLKGYAYVSAYVAAKHGVVGLTRALAVETARTGVTVNAVCPGYTGTDMVEETLATIQAKTGRSRAEALDSLTRFNPQGRLVEPDEVAAAVLWLCRDSSAAITGQSIAVAGGEVM